MYFIFTFEMPNVKLRREHCKQLVESVRSHTMSQLTTKTFLAKRTLEQVKQSSSVADSQVSAEVILAAARVQWKIPIVAHWLILLVQSTW